jgi:hypothetical protein
VIGTLQRQINGARRPRLAASADPSPSRHPRKSATADRPQASRSGGRAVKRTVRPK